ncbi:MAG TPA: cache domain-containing protein, partial [Vicinamibacterales bacterium]|nr:cache domain-containing protein [Vicinamibacterales bacterium]
LVRLQLTARLVASFPGLKALFTETDAATIQDHLRSYQQANPGTPLLIALGATGEVLARTDQAALASTPEPWLDELAAANGRPTVVAVADRPYHAAGAPAEAGGSIFGYVVAAAPIDSAFAGDLRALTRDEIVLLSQRGLLATTLPGGEAPWRTADEWRKWRGETDAAAVQLGSQRFAAREVALDHDPHVVAVILKSREEAIAPFHRIQRGLLLVGFITLVAAAAVAIWLTRALDPARPR